MKKFWLIALAALTIVGCARRPAQPQEEEQPQEEPEQVEEVTIDNPYTDFTAVTPEGEELSLSQLVGKTDFVLVDFWASWCGPCRAEIPNLIKVYEQYKEKGLVVLGVAVNDKPEDTLKAIEKDKITYPQILNSQNIAAETYDFNSIPTIYLFGPDGRVVAHDLRGKDINNKLAEIFQ